MGLWGVVKKAINSDLSKPLNQQVYEGLSHFTLLSHFAWAGMKYPFAGASDVTISSNTTWDAITHPQGYAKVKKLTINAGCTLTILQSPFIIFADEIVGGGAGAIINASGPNGASSGNFTCGQAYGATNLTGSPARVQGGCGGGLLIILCSKFSGTAITIKANGGNGYSNASNGDSSRGYGGQGAISALINNTGTQQEFDGSGSPAGTKNKAYLHPLHMSMGRGGSQYYEYSGTGGGSGGGYNAAEECGGGSGIGGGGGYKGNGQQPVFPVTPLTLLELLKFGCKGGGGGSAGIKSGVGTANFACGGGGGAILVFANDATSVTPTMQANGGTGAGNATNKSDGAAGVTYYINFAV